MIRYKLGPNDLDWRGTERGIEAALNEAFTRTGVPREAFAPTQWAKDKHGKSFPVEWRVLQGEYRGAEVNIDIAHTTDGPDTDHVGWQTAAKRSVGGLRGHILLNGVPYNRTDRKA